MLISTKGFPYKYLEVFVSRCLTRPLACDRAYDVLPIGTHFLAGDIWSSVKIV